MMSAGHECVSGTRGPGIVSIVADVLGMSVLRGMTRLGGVCEMCMCLAWGCVGGKGGEGGEWIRELSLGFTNPVGTGGVLDVCLCLGCGGVCWEWIGGLEGWDGVISV